MTAVSLRYETAADDDRRTCALLDAADIAFSPDPATELHADFESVVMEALCCDAAHCDALYPPAGHTYPRRG